MATKVEEISFNVRSEEFDFILTILTPFSRTHLYYLNKEEIKKKYNIDLDAWVNEYYNDRESEIYLDPMKLLKSLDYYKIPRR